MWRETLTPRADWQAKVESLGLVWHSADGDPYWNEAACYHFSHEQVAAIAQATRAVSDLLLAAGDHIIERGLFPRFGIPDWCVPLIVDAWEAEPPALNYGRFDFGYDGRTPPKLFEYNCDTPTSLIEAAVVQWFWKEERFPDAGQFNAIHEHLLDKWRDIAPLLPGGTVHFAHAEDGAGEDMLTTAYMMDLATQAGLQARRLPMQSIGWRASADGVTGAFVGLDGEAMATIYKLYPWEWMVAEDFGRNLTRDAGRSLWIEPIWKMIWSNKAILPILWDLAPGHPNLLRATFDAPASDSHVRKPILAREGANVTIVERGRTVAHSGGPYDGPCVFQDIYPLPRFDGMRPVIGSWSVDGEPAGMGIREDGLITGNLARFVPHVVD
jgi:glutathionylspermidine synthase